MTPPFRHRWRMNEFVRKGVIIVFLMTAMMASRAETLGVAAANVPNVDPSSVVPEQFRDASPWSQEKGWHWVTLSYDGTQRFTGSNYDYSVGKPLPAATYVATLVRTLSATESCADCTKISPTEEGPPSVMGGSNNPALAAAYAHLDNGPRVIIDSGNSAVKRWTKGSWYLNFSPTTRTFFSWTWIPDDGGFQGVKTEAALSTTVTPSLASLGSLNLSQSMTPGSRVFPIAGGYVVSQPYGCVPLNAGYPSATFCPSDRPSFHDGVDLAATAGTPIVAAASGTVTFAGIDPSTASGNSMIVIDLDGSNAGYETVYMHWEKSFVKVGDRVSAGQVVADVGSVGYSTGPHLHFSVRIGATNQTIDPLAWLSGSIQFATTNAQAGPAYAGVMQWQSLIQQAAAAHNVPAGLIAAIMAVESGGNPNAVSPAGALGLMQIMPGQLTRLGVPEDKWTDPASNIDAAARYLDETLGRGGAIQDAIARYFGSGCDALGTCTQN
ncbi:MAG: peptidoglycan DD-metalloendopeptidase family protein, partial [Nitrolancea sp.]